MALTAQSQNGSQVLKRNLTQYKTRVLSHTTNLRRQLVISSNFDIRDYLEPAGWFLTIESVLSRSALSVSLAVLVIASSYVGGGRSSTVS